MSTTLHSRDELLAVARDRFGYDDLRPGQLEAVESLLEGRDTLAVFPTGFGKSAVYQIAGLLIDGPTVIVSPLIALQKDQVDSIRHKDLAIAELVNSTKKSSENDETFARLERGEIEFLFLAPEQLRKAETLERLRAARPSLFVVDEAHCISEWGHDFRPDYLGLGAVVQELGHPTLLALTATASPEVRREITDRLHMRNPQVLVRGFDRPNLYLAVRAFDTEVRKRDALLQAVVEAPKPGIIYCATRKHAEELAQTLAGTGVRTAVYHGGMKTSDREGLQQAFMDDQVQVMVATNAFGMGVDKPNVRFVFHYEISDSVDSYYQEIGRAGRDGERADATLFYRPENLGVRKFLGGAGKVATDEIREVAEAVEQADGPVAIKDLAEQTEMSPRTLARVVSRLEDVGALTTTADGHVESLDGALTPAHSAMAVASAESERRENDRLRLERMQGYAEEFRCRRAYLLRHFGEETDDHCDFCDNCDLTAKDRARMHRDEEE